MRGGTLYVVATPLGHLGDLSVRAAELLRSVPVVAAEDTRRTRVLLDHLGATPRLISHHAHSGSRSGAAILRILEEGKDVALVSDAGTPAISDPGAALVALVRNAGHAIVPLPGPSAVTTALSAAGLPADRYVFLGFFPRKGPERARLLERTAREELTTVIFEAPGRIAELLRELAEHCGAERQAVVARELTKLHEEFRVGTLGELAARFAAEPEIRGECTVVVQGALHSDESDDAARAQRATTRLLAAGVSRRETASLVSELFDVSRNAAYQMALEGER